MRGLFEGAVYSEGANYSRKYGILVYRFPHTTIPTPLVSVLFLQQHPYFFVHLKKFFRSYSIRKKKMPNRDFLLRAVRT